MGYRDDQNVVLNFKKLLLCRDMWVLSRPSPMSTWVYAVRRALGLTWGRVQGDRFREFFLSWVLEDRWIKQAGEWVVEWDGLSALRNSTSTKSGVWSSVFGWLTLVFWEVTRDVEQLEMELVWVEVCVLMDLYCEDELAPYCGATFSLCAPKNASKKCVVCQMLLNMS